MLSFIKKFFGAKPTVNPCPDAPYKVENAVPQVAEFPFPKTVSGSKPVAKKPAAKKPAAKKPAPAKKPK